MNVWQAARVEPDRMYRSTLGPVQVWVQRVGDEVRGAVQRQPDEEAETSPLAPSQDAPPEDLEWGRWVVGDDGAALRFMPVMPDRPVVVRPESPVKIPPGREATFFVSIPVWVRITAGRGEKPTDLCEVPSQVLSGIWFGDPMEGELCYSIQTRARREIADPSPAPHRAICPVHVRNASPALLDVERLCVRVAHLSIYDGDVQPWTNAVTVTFRGEQNVSQIDYADGPPTGQPVGERLSEPRTPITKSLLKKTFSGLKTFAGI